MPDSIAQRTPARFDPPRLKPQKKGDRSAPGAVRNAALFQSPSPMLPWTTSAGRRFVPALELHSASSSLAEKRIVDLILRLSNEPSADKSRQVAQQMLTGPFVPGGHHESLKDDTINRTCEYALLAVQVKACFYSAPGLTAGLVPSKTIARGTDCRCRGAASSAPHSNAPATARSFMPTLLRT